MFKKTAFTLAEVLVTLVIIGIVAALTIPVVVQKYQQREFYTRFINAYNIFNNAYYQMKLDGDIDNKALRSDENLFLNKLRYKIKCQPNDLQCRGGGDIQYKFLNKEEYNHPYYKMYTNETIYSLPNGIDFTYTDTHTITVADFFRFIYIIRVDTNGINKGPNELGIDYFVFELYPYQTSLGDASLDNSYTYESRHDFLDNGGKLIFKDIESLKENCSSGKDGKTCAARLLLEGKMNY